MEVVKHNDFDELCYWTLLAMVHELKHRINDVKRLYYLELSKTLDNGLRLIFDETNVLEVAKHARALDAIDVYIDHVDDKDCPSLNIPLRKSFFEMIIDSFNEEVNFLEDVINWTSDEEDEKLFATHKNVQEFNKYIKMTTQGLGDGGGDLNPKPTKEKSSRTQNMNDPPSAGDAGPSTCNMTDVPMTIWSLMIRVVIRQHQMILMLMIVE
ncbi:hypothetical protein PVK06_024992 [Gossypium arboreum]|uniref:PB1-like domain-containing protein n=1 Tax=Gossypium arboreum TaxID=29729 RepID=A0ABR0PFL7_GOSAR|nr:hypothetical protein PVK06_024992 [Gossypium arboreum]